MLAYIGNNELVNTNDVISVYIQLNNDEWNIILNKRDSRNVITPTVLASFDNEEKAVCELKRLREKLRDAGCLIDISI